MGITEDKLLLQWSSQDLSVHGPLCLGYLKKKLIEVENTRLISMLEKLADFNIEVFHLPGSKNSTVDFLYRHTLPSVDVPEFPGPHSQIPRDNKGGW